MTSRARRRAGGSSRRTPSGTPSGRGFRLPIVPLVVLIGFAAIGGLIAYLIWQQSGESGDAAGVKEEADASPDLPGEWIDLAAIYGGPYSDTAGHARRDVDYVADGNSDPPAGGPHWGSSTCARDAESSPAFCGPAPSGIYRTPWEPETLVHNMEHGGNILWYNFTDTALRDELEEIIEDRLNARELLVMAPYADMEEDTIALTHWSRVDKFPVSEYSKERVEAFFDAHECRFNPEDICRR